jgi:hypothetical protein
MAFKTFAPGVLTASDVNTFLMRQTVIVCTSTTRPGSPNEGMTIYETDTDKTFQYTGTVWRSIAALDVWDTFTPTWVNLTVGNGTTTGRFIRLGRLTVIRGRVVFGSTTAITGNVSMGYPSGVGPGTYLDDVVGQTQSQDESAATFYSGPVKALSAGMLVHSTNHTFAANYSIMDFVTATKPFTWTTNDTLGVVVVMEGN